MINKDTLVLDCGSGHTKIGWSHQTFPQETYATVIGRPILRTKSTPDGLEIKDIMIGEDARKARSFLDLSYPVNEGVVKNWDDMTHIWDYGLKKMEVNPKESNILVTEPVFNSKKARMQMSELLFEKYQFKGAQLQIQALLSMFSEGKMTATVLDSGDSISYVVPCDEGYIMTNLIKRINLAGRKITEYLTKLLFLRGYAFNSSADFETVREIKEKLCFISKDLSQDRKLARETVCFEEEYTLPDGQVVTLGKERFEASEILFDPYKGGYELEGLGDLVFESIRNADTTCRPNLYKNIMLCGGSTLLPGFADRLRADMKTSYKRFINKNPKSDLDVLIKILAPPRRNINVFMGGAMFANILNGMDNMWITKKEWEESGFQIILKKICNNL